MNGLLSDSGGETIDLPIECLSPATAKRWHVAIIEAVMLWPDNAEARGRALHTSAVQILLEEQRLLDAVAEARDLADEALAAARAADVPSPESRKERAAIWQMKLALARIAWQIKDDRPTGFDLLEFAARATPLESLQAAKGMKGAAAEPYLHGIISGFILHETLGKVVLGRKDASIGRSAKIASEKFSNKEASNHLDKRVRISISTINNTIWPLYKPVAHLWAAHYSRRLETHDLDWPCNVSRISEFFSTAEAYRHLAETMGAFKSPSVLLVPGIAVRLPFPLAKAELSFVLAESGS